MCQPDLGQHLKRSLLVVVCALLLLCVGCGDGSSGDMYSISVFQFATNAPLDATREGFLQGMRDAGYEDGVNIRYDFRNAEGDQPTAQLIAQQIESSRSDLALVMGTPALQAALSEVKTKPIIFSAIANPFDLGAGTTPEDHLPHVTGAWGPSPIRQAFELLQEMLPSARRLGIVLDPGLANTMVNMKAAHSAAEEFGLEIIEASVGASGEVLQASQALATKDIDVFFVIPDHHVMDAINALASVGAAHQIPVFTPTTDLVAGGAAIAVGWDYSEYGRLAAGFVVRVMAGESPVDMPFETRRETQLWINLPAAEAQGLAISPELLARADVVIR